MGNKTRSKIEQIIDIVTAEEHSSAIQARVVFLLFAVIAAVMSVVNIITEHTVLLIVTFSFAVLCLVDWALVKISEKNNRAATVLFASEIAVLFTYFIITGGTDNFSVIWLLMLPSLGLFFFGTLGGTVLSFAMLFIMLVCFFSPSLQSITTDYTMTFRMRFPLVYSACFVTAYFLEAVRRHTMQKLRIAREKYQYLYNHDPLTGARTRTESDAQFAQICKKAESGKVGLVMFDIDFFRDFNTNHGHNGGDRVLKYVAKMLIDASEPYGGVVYRWGGEEFLILYGNGEVAAENAETIRREIEKTPFLIEGKTYYITISGGVYVVNAAAALEEGLATVVQKADDNLYAAKNSGRNKVISSGEDEE